jgi:hypothetical protein
MDNRQHNGMKNKLHITGVWQERGENVSIETFSLYLGFRLRLEIFVENPRPRQAPHRYAPY